MIKNILSILVLLFSFHNGYAQSEPEMYMMKAKNSLLLSGAKEFTFTFDLVNTKANVQQSQNGVLVASETKYHLDITSSNMEIYFNGTDLYTLAHDDEEITITKPDQDEEEGLSFTTYFENYKNDFHISGKDLKFGKYQIELKPKSAKADVKKIIIKFENYDIKEITRHEKNGTISTVKVTHSQNVNSAAFEPNMSNFSSYDVNDLR